MIERIYISEIQKELNYRTRKSVRRWCRNNFVLLRSDIGSNRQFAILDEFENAKDKNCYSIPQSVNSRRRFYSGNKKMKQDAIDYKPIGDHEKLFFTRLLRINSKVSC